MAFDIHLPQARLEASSGLWSNRLPIDHLDAALAAAPDRTAFVGWNSALSREIRLTYAELASRVDKVAMGLVERGLGKGDVVAFQLPNWWEFIALFFACNRIGAVANPLMPIFRQRELRFMMGFAEAKVAVVPALWRGFDHIAMMREIRSDLPHLQHVLAVGGEGEESFEGAFLDRPAPSEAECRQLALLRPEPNDVVELIYTSGTSGEPKAVMHTANTVLAPPQCFIRDIPVTGSDVIFMGSPYAHQTGFLYGMLMPVMLGTRTVALDQWSARDAARLIEAEGVTWSMGSTPFLSDMVNLRRGAARPRRPHAPHLGVRRCTDPARAGAAGQGRDGPRRAVLLGHDRERRRHPDAQERFPGEGVLHRRPRTARRRGAHRRRGQAPAARRYRRTPAGTRDHPVRRLPQEARSSTPPTPKAGSTPATSPAWIRTATSASSAAPRT